MAVELLEQGRGILWNQLARFDTSLAALESLDNQGRDLGNKFAQLGASLKKHAQVEWRQWDEPILAGSRRIGICGGRNSASGWLLLPPHFDDFQQTAESGPIIIFRDRPPVRVPLRCSLDDVDELCLQFSELIQDLHAYGGNRESWIKQSLRELWSSVVEPIVTVLQNEVQLPMSSRIWWYLTSEFTILPFHATGPYRKVGKNLMDIYVSSYAPSLSALIRARSQKKARYASGTANVVSFAVVGPKITCAPRGGARSSEGSERDLHPTELLLCDCVLSSVSRCRLVYDIYNTCKFSLASALDRNTVRYIGNTI